mmetsp:Transcript_13710/g.29860  ORF Transcript_13710/g.29860 Transcript_13710/m.29860 type:complete len:250 (-) Transcript_13710:704-1453(-)
MHRSGTVPILIPEQGHHRLGIPCLHFSQQRVRGGSKMQIEGCGISRSLDILVLWSCHVDIVCILYTQYTECIAGGPVTAYICHILHTLEGGNISSSHGTIHSAIAVHGGEGCKNSVENHRVYRPSKCCRGCTTLCVAITNGMRRGGGRYGGCHTVQYGMDGRSAQTQGNDAKVKGAKREGLSRIAEFYGSIAGDSIDANGGIHEHATHGHDAGTGIAGRVPTVHESHDILHPVRGAIESARPDEAAVLD